MRKIAICFLTAWVIMSYNSVVDAKMCNIGAEIFYQNFQKYIPMEYQYSRLNNYLSPSNNNMYAFTVRNSRTKKSKTTIRIKVDEEGYIDEISLKIGLPDSDVLDIKIIEATCFQSIGLSKDEIKWLVQHEKMIPVATNSKIKHSEVYSRVNDLVIYKHELPLSGGLTYIFIDRLTLDGFYNKMIKPFKNYNK